jgi:hypothetical protein
MSSKIMPDLDGVKCRIIAQIRTLAAKTPRSPYTREKPIPASGVAGDAEQPISHRPRRGANRSGLPAAD